MMISIFEAIFFVKKDIYIINRNKNIRLGWIKGIYIYTVIGASEFALMMLLAPKLVESIFGIPVSDPMIYGVAVSIWLAFGTLYLLGLRSALKFLLILSIQCTYKSIPVIGVLLPLILKGERSKIAQA